MPQSTFDLHYQPIVDLKTGAVTSVEALLRWHHPERGAVSPGTFVPVAEETGLIVKLGAWALREACRQVRAWQQTCAGCTQLRVAVNVSVQQLEHPTFPDYVAQVLGESGLAPTCLTLEVTESAIMKNDQRAQAALAPLKKLGVKLAIDDFGTGHSSFSRLGYLDIDVLKIDRSFIGTLGEGRSALEIVRAISTAATSLGLGVVAEGIETSEQCAALKNLPCEAGQGYLFSRPLPQTRAEELLVQSVKPWQQSDTTKSSDASKATSNK